MLAKIHYEDWDRWIVCYHKRYRFILRRADLPRWGLKKWFACRCETYGRIRQNPALLHDIDIQHISVGIPDSNTAAVHDKDSGILRLISAMCCLVGLRITNNTKDLVLDSMLWEDFVESQWTEIMTSAHTMQPRRLKNAVAWPRLLLVVWEEAPSPVKTPLFTTTLVSPTKRKLGRGSSEFYTLFANKYTPCKAYHQIGSLGLATYPNLLHFRSGFPKYLDKKSFRIERLSWVSVTSYVLTTSR